MAGAAPQEIQTGILRPGDVGYDPRSQVSATLPNTQQNPMLTNSLSQAAGQPMMGSFGGELMPVGEPAPFPGGQRSFSDGPQMQKLMPVTGATFGANPLQPDPVHGVMPMAPISGKGGGAVAPPAAAKIGFGDESMPGAQPISDRIPGTQPPQGQYAPMAPQQQGFNVNQASAGALQGAIGATQQAMQGPINIGAYANPFTSAVIDRTQQDIERQRQMAQNTIGAQATAARAFGGSRQGVAEGVMAGEYGRMAGDMAAQQRQANYSQALQAAMADRQARLGAASQLGGLGQQAFQTGQTIQQQQAQQGLLQQGIQQALIDAARQQYAGYTGAPSQALQAPLAALGIAQQGGAKTVTESQSPGLLSYLQVMGQMCWVAREVYGEDNPKWLQFREWVIGYSPNWFYNAYSKYGERVAKVVAKVPALKLVIRPFMDAKRKAMGYK